MGDMTSPGAGAGQRGRDAGGDGGTPQHWAAGLAAALPPEVARQLQSCLGSVSPDAMRHHILENGEGIDDDLDRDLDTLVTSAHPLPCRHREGQQGPLPAAAASRGRTQGRLRQGGLTRDACPSGSLADPARDVGITAGSLRATLGLVDPRSDPRVHAIVAEKQLPTELPNGWASRAWAQHDDVLHELDVHTDGAASLNDVWSKAVRSRGFSDIHCSWGRSGGRHVRASGLRSREPRVRRGLAAVVERSRAPCADVRRVGDLCGSATGEEGVAAFGRLKRQQQQVPSLKKKSYKY